MTDPESREAQTAAGGQPTAYIRIAHTHTLKAGWQHETTVSITWPFASPHDSSYALRELLSEADKLGRQESQRRELIDRNEMEAEA